MRLRGGVVKWFEGSAVQLRDDRGEVVGAVLVARDVTARHQAAADADEERSRAAQNEKLRALGQMASGVAHNLNQSLALIAGYAELAADALAADQIDRAALRDKLRVISQAAMDGGETVKRLLTFARGRAVDTLPTAIDVGCLIGEVAALTAPRWRDLAQAEGRPVTLRVDVAERILVVGREPDLREALTNLIFNAVDAMPAGGTLRLAARPIDDGVEIEVADSGVGMTEAVRSRIFEPFFSTKGQQGTGLGLAMVFAIVEQHGGTVDVRSAPGRGTTFVLRLPSTKRATPPGPTVELPQAGRPLRVLVVDDEPFLRQAVEIMLRRDAHQVRAVDSAEAALEALATATYDVVVSDLAMGAGMNGWDLAARIKATWPSTRFVLCSGLGLAVDPKEARARGADVVLPKPYTPTDLRRAVQVASA
jgi:signal transduction histidine kinase/CheY-like chemotaxis protein